MIIGLAGSFGAGKGVVVDYLIQKRGFKHYSSSGLITEFIKERGMPVNRDSMISVGNDLRAQYGPAYIVEENYRRALEAGGDAILEALRAVAEVKKVKELGGVVIGIDADPKIRYERAVARGSEKDNVSFEEFLDQERRESNPDDPTKQDVFGALKEANYVLNNNGTFDELKTQVDEVLKKIAL